MMILRWPLSALLDECELQKSNHGKKTMFSAYTTQRRDFMYQLSAGVRSIALSWLLHQGGVTTLQADEREQNLEPLSPKKPHLLPRAKSIIFFVMDGGPSQVDTFDPKPVLSKYHGTVFKRENVKSNQVSGSRYFVRSPFRFRKYGECGMDVSDLFRETAANVDDMAFVRSRFGDGGLRFGRHDRILPATQAFCHSTAGSHPLQQQVLL